MGLPVIRTSRASAATGASSSGCGPGQPKAARRHVGFVAGSQAAVDAAYATAMAAGATDNGPPGARLHYDPRYYAGSVLDPDGYSLEFVFKPWQHAEG